MRVLFVHQNFPAQFQHLAPALVARGHEVRALKIGAEVSQPLRWRGVSVVTYRPQARSSAGIHPWVADLETKTIRGEACWRAAIALDAQGFVPDVIYAHPGWGESLFLKQVWADAKLVLFGEFFYGGPGSDAGFDPEFDTPDAAALQCRLQMKNLNHLAQLPQADRVISPTHWQASRFPPPWRERIDVVHDGIDTDVLKPDPSVRVTLADGTRLQRGDEVITFVARHLEPYRGFHTFMRALPVLLKARPNAHFIVVGEDGVSYGAACATHGSWRERMLAEVGSALAPLAMQRVHFVGRLSRDDLTRVLQMSAVHVYLTYPFVLSWSLLEAMSMGCAIVASDTAPVREAIQDGVHGVLVDFFRPSDLAAAVSALLDAPQRRQALGRRARERVAERYDLRRVCLPRQLALIESMADQLAQPPDRN
ncbi:MAG: glycosyltransferase [Hydrogenophaga sp.]|uniref:glycosyltransferase n=1 Tax=Hydrogenophaga sp. TaxID=1904254 RepID=UPI001D2A4D8E|nr:glycosyltransferase [Hydrogenophaga sp.]MBX3610557.1 glycosyltransferase [Hydrogenophaga sp.]